MRTTTIIALLALGASCGKPEQPRPERGHDPWVVRATLDERPRMLVAALANDLWVAYDTARGALYRVASSGVNFDGAVYNTHHGPQPVTQGGVLLTSQFEAPWHLMHGRDDLRPSVQYRGHRFEDGHLVLQYTLTVAEPALSVTVEERPELARGEQGAATLERRFRVLSPPKGVSVVLDFNAPRLVDDDDVTLVTKADELTGKLTLRAEGETRLTFAFTADRSHGPEDRAAAAQPAGQRLIADSDCATCHNPVSHTVGPSFKEIAARYKTNPDTVLGLARKIRQGGADQWGEAAMVAHPGMSDDDASTIASYILETFDPGDREGEEATHPLTAVYAQTKDFDPSKLIPGLNIGVYELGHPLDVLPKLDAQTSPNASFTAAAPTFEAMADFRRRDPSTGFLMRAQGWLEVDQDGEYDFRVDHDGIAELSIDEWALVRDVPARTRRLSPWVSITLTKGLHPIVISYATSAADPHLSLRWQPPNEAEGVVPARVFKSLPSELTPAPGTKPYALVEGVPGRGRPLTSVHPSFAIRPLRPHGFKPMVGGIDFLAPDKAVISTWDARGAVYRLENLDAADPEQIRITRIAEGLNEPLGLKVVNGLIYVLQKHELTRLVDHDGDGLIDDYQTVSNAWGTTGNFHEFAFGLDHRDEHFYATLAIGIEPGGAAMKLQNKDRGRVMRVSERTGAISFLARGLRTPNGIGFGTDGELFVTDNEGDWLPANKLIHVEQDAFYGCRSVEPEETRAIAETPPAVWLPVDEIANSPSQPIPLNIGPYQNQMLYADVTYGGLNRVVLHKVDGHYQGCAMPFTQGFEAGINRAVTGPDGAIYVGGIGNPGNWAQEHKLWYGLERLAYTGAPAFEMLDLALHADGIAITFTEPLRAGDGDAPSDYALSQWRYVATSDYGGPKVDEHALQVTAVRVSPDRKHVFLAVDALKTGHVVRVRLREAPVAASGRAVWTTDAYCTVNHLPKDSPGDRFEDLPTPSPNTLSVAEREAGFRLLFDGRTLGGFRGHRKQSAQASWQVRDGWLGTRGARGVDLVSVEEFGDFELDLEWRVAKGGNGGIFYRAGDESRELPMSAVEMQVLDDDDHPDGRAPLHRAGSAYDLFAPNARIARPAGEVNHARIVARGTKVEHWLNGHLVLAYDTASEAFARQVADSKFKDAAELVRPRGRIGLQHHGDQVWYRNVKVRPLVEAR